MSSESKVQDLDLCYTLTLPLSTPQEHKWSKKTRGRGWGGTEDNCHKLEIHVEGSNVPRCRFMLRGLRIVLSKTLS